MAASIELGRNQSTETVFIRWPKKYPSVAPRCGRIPSHDVIKWKYFPRYWPNVRGIHRSLVNSPHRPMTRTFGILFDLRLNIRFSKQWRRRWFETPLLSLWPNCNESVPGATKYKLCASFLWCTLYLIQSLSSFPYGVQNPIKFVAQIVGFSNKPTWFHMVSIFLSSNLKESFRNIPQWTTSPRNYGFNERGTAT